MLNSSCNHNVVDLKITHRFCAPDIQNTEEKDLLNSKSNNQMSRDGSNHHPETGPEKFAFENMLCLLVPEHGGNF